MWPGAYLKNELKPTGDPASAELITVYSWKAKRPCEDGASRRRRATGFIASFVSVSFTRQTEIFGRALEELQKWRNQADYEPEQPGRFASSVVAQQAVAKARAAITLLDQIEADANRRATAIASIHPPP